MAAVLMATLSHPSWDVAHILNAAQTAAHADGNIHIIDCFSHNIA